MEYIDPNETNFTIYSRSGCHYCTKVKQLLKSKSYFFTIINCDEYILEDRESFLNHMKSLTNTEIKGFPMVFYNKKFIGGYNETKDFVDNLEKINAFDKLDDEF